jgi:DeoR family transcriptional regulator of aga operon
MLRGVDGLSRGAGCRSEPHGEAQVNGFMAHRARRVVGVDDGSKLDRHAFLKICDIADVKVIITGCGAEAHGRPTLAWARRRGRLSVGCA